MNNYELIEHTADVGVRVRGRDLKELFKLAGLAMFDIVAEEISKRPTKKEELEIKLKADNLEELFINWLNELLSLSATKELIFLRFKIKKVDKNNLEAVAIGNDFKNYKVNTEIKAATYHDLKIEKDGKGYQVEIIFDV